MEPVKTIVSVKTTKELIDSIEAERQNKLEEMLDKRKKGNKFDFFFMICLTTTIGYLGKYSMNLLLDYILTYFYGNQNNTYDKRLFLYYTMGLYGFSMLFAIISSLIFELSILESDTREKKEKGKEEENEENKENKKITIFEICGYIIYSEKRKIKKKPKMSCCGLCCESLQNCCNQTCCSCLQNFGCDECCRYIYDCICRCECLDLCDCCDCYDCCECCDCCDCYTDFRDCLIENECYCTICENCKYDPLDYEKNEEAFIYCYKSERKCQWWNKCITNDTTIKVFPYMLGYFTLQLSTIGFEKQYESYKDVNIHRKTLIIIFVSTFILFFYFSLAFTRLLIDDYDDKKELEEKSFKDKVSRLSNDILNGIIGVLFFNALFSFIFSIFYLSNMSDEVKSFFFEDNINIIFMPILMNKFYYFTLNYYCIYTAEQAKKFDIISSSSVISFYIIIWNLAMTLIKWSISDENKTDGYNYFNILYIIQICISSIPSAAIGIFVFISIIYSTGIIQYFCDDCDDCSLIVENFTLHKILFFIFSFLFCFGGLWIRIVSFGEFEYECCSVGNCCDFGDNCCNVYCFDNEMFCDCCCCDKYSCFFSECCYMKCNACKVCGCCKKNQ